MAQVTKQDVIKYIEGITVLELAEFVKELENKFGVTAAAPVAVATPAAGAAATAGAPAEEKTEITIIMKNARAGRVKII